MTSPGSTRIVAALLAALMAGCAHMDTPAGGGAAAVAGAGAQVGERCEVGGEGGACGL